MLSNSGQKLSIQRTGALVYRLMGIRRSQYLVLLTFLGVILLYSLVTPYLVGRIVDLLVSYQSGESLNALWFLIGVIAFFWVVVSVIRLTVKMKLSELAIEIVSDTKIQAFDRVLAQPLESHRSEGSGNKLQRVMGACAGLEDFLSIAKESVLPVVIVASGVSGAFFSYNWALGVLALAYVGLFIAVQIVFQRKIVCVSLEAQHGIERSGGTLVDSIGAVNTLKLLGTEKAAGARFAGAEVLSRELNRKKTRIIHYKWYTFQLVNGTFIGSSLVIAANGVLLGVITPGQLSTLFIYVQRLLESLGDGAGVVDQFLHAFVRVSRLQEYFEEDRIQRSVLPFPKEWHYLSFCNVTVSYLEQRAVLQNISLSVKKGERLGIEGPSGSGKSTLVKAILGVVRPETGQVLIGSVSVSEIRRGDLFQAISIVPQEIELLDTSLRENILLGSKCSSEELEKAVGVAELSDVISRLSDGLDSLVGEKGYSLSGGERQRVGIARALLRNPEILILDEATSALDQVGENSILEALSKNYPMLTMIIISHRPAPLQFCSKIIKLTKNKI